MASNRITSTILTIAFSLLTICLHAQNIRVTVIGNQNLNLEHVDLKVKLMDWSKEDLGASSRLPAPKEEVLNHLKSINVTYEMVEENKQSNAQLEQNIEVYKIRNVTKENLESINSNFKGTLFIIDDYTFSDKNEAQVSLYKDLLAEAQTEATLIAKAMNKKIGNIIKVEQLYKTTPLQHQVPTSSFNFDEQKITVSLVVEFEAIN